VHARSLSYGTWEISALAGEDGMPVRPGKAQSHNPGMHDAEKSDAFVVPLKATNKGALVLAASLEGRGAVVGNNDEMSAGQGAASAS
jgi:hypothetical protein